MNNKLKKNRHRVDDNIKLLILLKKYDIIPIKRNVFKKPKRPFIYFKELVIAGHCTWDDANDQLICTNKGKEMLSLTVEEAAIFKI